MAALILQNYVYDAQSPGSSVVPSNWVPPTVGATSTVIAVVHANSANTVISPGISTPTGTGQTWTPRGSGVNVNGTLGHTRIQAFSMNSSGGETAPTFTFTNMTAANAWVRITFIEVTQQAGTPLDGNAGSNGSTDTSNPVSLSSNAYTSTNAPCTLIAIASLNGTGTGTPSFSWGSGFTDYADFAYGGNFASSIATAPAPIAGGSYTATVTAMSSTAQACSAVYLIAVRDGNVPLTASMASSSSMSASITVALTAAMASSSSFGASATETQSLSAALASSSSFGANATESDVFSADMASSSSFGANATESDVFSADMASSSSFGANATESDVFSADMASSSAFTAGATGVENLSVDMASSSAMNADMTLPGLYADMSSSSSFGASASGVENLSTDMVSSSAMNADATLPGFSADMVSSSAFTAGATGVENLSVDMVSSSSFVLNEIHVVPLSTSMISASSFGASPAVSVSLSADMISASVLSVSGVSQFSLSTDMVSSSSFVSSLQPPVVPITLDVFFEVEPPSWLILVDEASWLLVVEGTDVIDAQRILKKQYTYPVRISNRNGVDLSTVTVTIALSTSFEDTPADTDYQAAEIIELTDDYIRAHLLVDRSTMTDGVYAEWVGLDTGTESIREKVGNVIIGATP